MIFVTGDTHGGVDFAKLAHFAQSRPGLTKDDYVIICGDFGGVWWDKTLKADLQPYEQLPFTVLFADGNHENFDLLYSMPERVWRGGRVHFVCPTVIHLMRGQVFELEGNKIFTFGGATSVDSAYRTQSFSWWSQEVPSRTEFEEGLKNLSKHGNRVDYIITHSCGQKALSLAPAGMLSRKRGVYPENIMLSRFEEEVSFKRWYFGHYHADCPIGERFRAVYNDVIPLGI